MQYNFLMHIQKYLAERAAENADLSIVQIGAHFGDTSSDPLFDFLITQTWQALLVEPIPHAVSKLQKNYTAQPHVRIAPYAITDYEGMASMHMFDFSSPRAAQFPLWAAESASLYLDRTALGWEKFKQDIQRINVPCCTLQFLFDKYQIDKIDVLQIDAEGHDFQILKQFDFEKYCPVLINLEIVNLPKDEQKKCYDILYNNGYECEKHGYDLCAYKTK